MKIGGLGEPPEFIRPDTFQVRPGDTLESLARSFGVDAAALARENGLPPGGELKPGQELVLPSPGGSGRSGRGVAGPWLGPRRSGEPGKPALQPVGSGRPIPP